MSILVRFTGAPGTTAEKYDGAMPRIEASGTFPPDGLDYLAGPPEVIEIHNIIKR